MRTSLLLLGLAACAPKPTKPNETAAASRPPNAPQADAVDPRFTAMIRDAAAPYQAWGRVDEHPNIAPGMCDIPRPLDFGSKGRVHLSESADAPHGKKLYYLWASNRDAYNRIAVDGAVDNGFTIVKESFAAVETGEAKTEMRFLESPPLHDKLRVGDHWLTLGAAKGLYVMTKVGVGDGTDAGWIYGTIVPSGEVTSAGRVASCIGCHEDAPHDRLFGPKRGETHGY